MPASSPASASADLFRRMYNRELRRRLEAAERRDWISTTAIKALRRAVDADVAIKALQQVQRQWVEEDFPDAERVAEIADQIVSKFQRARQ